MAMALGIFSHNIMPGITTIDKVADDVYADHLDIRTEHYHCEPMDVAFINSKGFGGNNATAAVFSPAITMAMLQKRYGDTLMAQYQAKLITVEAKQAQYQQRADFGQFDLIYKFGDGQIDDNEITISSDSIQLPGFENSIPLSKHNPFADMM
jgi:acetoacetyl-[acyl-carrier protein] synthase